MFTEQKVRALLFHLSVLIFCAGLPLILSFALGYKFNPRTFKFTKTGIVVLKTQPAGANIYLNNKSLKETTPATVYELLPGNYNISLELQKHYPWNYEVSVEAGKVTRLDKIILFPLRPDISQLNKEKISSFWIDEGGDSIYYINQKEKVIYESDLEGRDFREVALLAQNLNLPLRFKVSADKNKLLCFNNYQIAVVDLESGDGSSVGEPTLVADDSEYKITDVFWYSDNYHLVAVTERNIDVYEARPYSSAVNLLSLDKKNIPVFYDTKTDTLYFLDAQKGADGKVYDNVYGLNLSSRINPLEDFIKPKTDE